MQYHFLAKIFSFRHKKLFRTLCVVLLHFYFRHWQAFALTLHLVTSGTSKTGESALTDC